MNVRLTYSYKGTAVEGGRKSDDDKEVEQAFNVYLRHKRVTRNIKDNQEVTHTIEYKYVSVDDVLADKCGTTAALTVPETPYAPTPTKPVTDKGLTTYVDENGELIIPDENGTHPGKSLEG